MTYTSSNLVGLGLMTNRVEFVRAAQAQIEHGLDREDAKQLCELVATLMEERQTERDQFFATLNRLQQLRNAASGFIERLDADIDVLIASGATWGGGEKLQEARREAERAKG